MVITWVIGLSGLEVGNAQHVQLSWFIVFGVKLSNCHNPYDHTTVNVHIGTYSSGCPKERKTSETLGTVTLQLSFDRGRWVHGFPSNEFYSRRAVLSFDVDDIEMIYDCHSD